MTPLADIIAALSPPYRVEPMPLPGIDFNRELHPPGSNAKVPDGAVVIRVDGDFWVAAVLPWDYRDMALRDIIAVLYPDYADEAIYTPDSGSTEQTLYFLRQEIAHLKVMNKMLNTSYRQAHDDLERIRTKRPDINFMHKTRRRRMDEYFIAQYTQLLDAFAHAHVPSDLAPGLCAWCKLDMGNRIHAPHYIARRAASGPKLDITDYIGKPDDDEEIEE